MLLFPIILALSIARVNALGSIFGRNSFKSSISVRQQTGPCVSECAVLLGAVANCTTSPDPFCGCSQLLPAAGPCKTCLQQTNTTIGGVLNALTVAEAVVLCNCQNPSCGDLILASRQCQATQPTNPNCVCPAIVKDTDCYTCLEANDTSIADSLRGDVSRCKSVLSSASASPSSASATSSSKASASSSPTPTSDGKMMMSIPNSVWFSLSIVVIALIYEMF